MSSTREKNQIQGPTNSPHSTDLVMPPSPACRPHARAWPASRHSLPPPAAAPVVRRRFLHRQRWGRTPGCCSPHPAQLAECGRPTNGPDKTASSPETGTVAYVAEGALPTRLS